MHIRYNEPKDPELYCISKVLPDHWLDERWPQRRFICQGCWQSLRTSQAVRMHLLVFIKKLESFNRVCRELAHNMDFRRFCRLRSSDPAPTPKILSLFRDIFGLRGWTQLHLMLLRSVARLSTPSVAGLFMVDASDFPAAIRKTSKKKTIRR